MNNIHELNERLLVPHDCYIILTSKCNMRCRHCYGQYGANTPPRELSGLEWEAVFSDLEKNGVFFINISGGEPTLHPDFISIIQSLVRHEIYFILTTNGVFNSKILNTIISAKNYLVGLKISLDGPDYLSHGFLRRDTTGNINTTFFRKTFENIEHLQKAQIPFSIATCIHKKNINRFEELLDIIIKIKPVSWFISAISIDGRSKDNLDIFASDTDVDMHVWEKIYKTCSENNIYVKFIDMPNVTRKQENDKFVYTCPAAKLFCEIYSDGQVSPCPLSRLNIPSHIISFENIKNKSIKDIWQGEAFTRFLELSNDGCEGCSLKSRCGRCIPQSFAWFNDHKMPAPYCITRGERLGLKNLKELKKQLYENALRLERFNYIKGNRND